MKWGASLAVGVLFACGPQAGAEPAFTPSANPAAAFSEAVQVGDVLYLSPFLGIPAGESRPADGLAAQSKAAMDNLGAALKRHGLDYDAVFSCTAMITNASDPARVAAFNAVYKTYFKTGRLPVRSVFGPADIPAKAELELQCMAYSPKAAVQ